MTKRPFLIVSLLALAALRCQTVRPEWTYNNCSSGLVTLTGTVNGYAAKDFQPLPGATVTVRRTIGAAFQVAVITDMQGRFAIGDLNPFATYELLVEIYGFKSVKQRIPLKPQYCTSVTINLTHAPVQAGL
jgi:hypothetical protein